MDDKDLEDRVQVRAYALWEQDGRPEGRAEEYWHRAVALIEEEQASGQASSMSEDEAGPAPRTEPDTTLAAEQAEAPTATKNRRARKKAG